ncbi:glucose-6-phosphate dehydrogenase [Mycobacterium sp. CVI_P3]|uniref:Glucose-6-phosphate 1-dehydrogenase n=1 Tax=Mycobacterium pinniadriaticum TaxID=2994102 RepID=A0ABT3SN12_9MYCO|nr:glucose-6-phosphate dehydrogenase [Mycobacterium pinniadriaticum]MCX2934491.1 glucose-6-phosphate dehydrogenase [Mycobacterium pinniadriaticum]MCX2940923.1 glucose-6-phosphate dehydrogenase [Mycobacterium pinniadriaticum]
MTPSSAQNPGPADVLVVFGITGDLAKKMTFRSLYRLERRGLLGCPVVGVAFDDWSAAELRKHAREAIAATGEPVDDDIFARFADRLSMVSGDFADAATYDKVAAAISGSANPVFYLEIPPSLFGRVVDGLAGAGLTGNARVVVEKPFGHDLSSAKALNDQLSAHLQEWQIYRIDHFLGKEPAMDIRYIRFSNSIIEPLWNRDRIEAVQITMAENFGVADRGHFYDPVGALRDVVQNHLLQLIGLIASEPSSGGPDGFRDKRAELFKCIRPADPSHYVRGQYAGYLDVDGVAPGSATETFAALKLHIDNWRWSGVPFFIRAGKALPLRATEIRVIFKRPPPLPFLPKVKEPNELIFRIDPNPGVDLVLQAKDSGADATRAVNLSLVFAEEMTEAPEPYERLLFDAMHGDSSQFIREDAVEETWRIVQPLLESPPPVEVYQPGSWGPSGTDTLVAGFPAWRQPWLPAHQ